MTWLNRLLDRFFPPPTEEQKEEQTWCAFGFDLNRDRSRALRTFPHDPPADAMRRWRRKQFGLEDE